MSDDFYRMLVEELKLARKAIDEDPVNMDTLLKQWSRDLSAISLTCSVADPNFNRTGFELACGYETPLPWRN